MSGRVAILTEEKSMTAFLRYVLPSAFPEKAENVDWILIHHRGKTELEASIPRKLRAFREPNIRFLITRDNDGGDCVRLKQRLHDLIPPEPSHPVRIRIVCQELESWFLGDPEALVAAYPSAARHPSFRSWTRRDPDAATNASELVGKLTGTSAKVRRAEAIAGHIVLDRNRSQSFKAFFSALDELLS